VTRFFFDEAAFVDLDQIQAISWLNDHYKVVLRGGGEVTATEQFGDKLLAALKAYLAVTTAPDSQL
jgi:hypothetical protein